MNFRTHADPDAAWAVNSLQKLKIYTNFPRFGLKYCSRAMQNWSNSESRYN
jgi:hypothetical protein